MDWITKKTYKFYWVHIHLIQKLTLEELSRYCESISMSNFPSGIISLLLKAVDMRRDELSKNFLGVEHSEVALEDIV